MNTAWVKAFVWVLPFILLLSGTYVWMFHPEISRDVRATVPIGTTPGSAGDGPGAVGGTSDQVVLLPENHLIFMNRVFNDRDHEIAYCGLIDANGVMRPHLADTITASPTEIEFSFANCPLDRYPAVAMIHTHPDGSMGPSATDEREYRNSPFELMCIQSGPEPATVGTITDRFRCYTEGNGTMLERISVKITDCKDCM